MGSFDLSAAATRRAAAATSAALNSRSMKASRLTEEGRAGRSVEETRELVVEPEDRQRRGRHLHRGRVFADVR